jgi:hypothetical protein
MGQPARVVFFICSAGIRAEVPAPHASVQQRLSICRSIKFEVVPLWFMHVLVVTCLKTRNWAAQPDDDLRCSMHSWQ